MHFLLISENEFFHKIKRDGITILHGIHVWQLKLNYPLRSVPCSLQPGETRFDISCDNAMQTEHASVGWSFLAVGGWSPFFAVAETSWWSGLWSGWLVASDVV